MPSDDAYELLVAAIAPAVSYARERGVPLAIETSSTSTRDIGFVHSLADAVEFSRDAEIGVCVELQNCWFDCHLRRTFREHVDRFAIVQVNDFKVGDGARLNRRVPGDGDMPVEWLLGTLLDAGYAGSFELEVVGPRIEEEGYPAAIQRGLEWMSERLVALGSVTGPVASGRRSLQRVLGLDERVAHRAPRHLLRRDRRRDALDRRPDPGRRTSAGTADRSP